MTDSPEPRRALTVMVWGLRIALVAFGVAVALPLVLLVAACSALSVLTAAADLLAHAGGFEHDSFAVGLLASGVVVFLVLVATIRALSIRREALDGLAGWRRSLVCRPLSVAIGSLGALSAAALAALHDRPCVFSFVAVAFVASFVVLVVVVGPPWLGWQAFRLLRGCARWAPRSAYWTGAVTALTVAASAASVTAGALVAGSLMSWKEAPSIAVYDDVRSELASAAPGTERARRALEDVAEDVGPDTPSAFVLPSAAIGRPSSDDAEAARACIERMAAEEKDVQQQIARAFRLGPEDALDIVRDALAALCSHPRRGVYVTWKAGALLHRAAKRRAIDRLRRRRTDELCARAIEAQCSATYPSEALRLIDYGRVLDRVWCQLDEADRRLLTLWIYTDHDYESIGREIGRTSSQAKDDCQNAYKRLKTRALELCGQ